MVGESVVERRDRRAERRAATVREILDTAWRLAGERGLTGWPLKDVADAVGMRTPSLYVYFASKNDLYDAMFADGYRRLLEHGATLSREGSPRQVLHRAAEGFVDFCVEDPARFQLLFLRTLPGFEPSGQSYGLAQQALALIRDLLGAAGQDDPVTLDLYTALVTGLASQQISNDPGGDRWRRMVDVAVDRGAVGSSSGPERGGVRRTGRASGAHSRRARADRRGSWPSAWSPGRPRPAR